MIRKVMQVVLSLLYLVGLPLFAWWLSTLLLSNPPVIAPFLVASPMYAMIVAGAIMSRSFHPEWDLDRVPADERETKDITDRHPDLFEKYLGQIAFINDEALQRGVAVWKGWILVDRKIWLKLSEGAREFMLVRNTDSRNRAWWKTLLHYATFLAAYLLACINLWFVLVVHIGFGVTLAVYAVRNGERYETERDGRTLAVTRDYESAREYLTVIMHNERNRKARLAALRTSAAELGLI